MNETSCLILVQNDMYWLPYALESTKHVFNDYVIYDVGSTDNTPNIIDWFSEIYKGRLKIRTLPDCSPEVQGTFRNAMIAEGERDWFWILDGDEIYDHMGMYPALLDFDFPKEKMYGVIKRKEFSSCLTKVYNVERTHHRLYSRTAIWKGTHPGEIPVYDQNAARCFDIRNVICYHMHNVERSTVSAQKREKRKSQQTYHPGDLVKVNLLNELEILRKPINNFPVAPALERLQYEYKM